MKTAENSTREKCSHRVKAGYRPLIQRLEKEQESGSSKATDRLRTILNRLNRSLSTCTYSQVGRHPHGV